MAHIVYWDTETNSLMINASLKREDIRFFIDELNRVISKIPGTNNWIEPLKLVFQYGSEIELVKFWRTISGCSIKEALDDIRAIRSGNAKYPNGTEYPPLTDEQVNNLCAHGGHNIRSAFCATAKTLD